MKLYCKAKAEPECRFYLLYDKIWREDILAHAYQVARAHAGAPGVDGQSFAQIEADGRERWLSGLREELRTKTYRAQPVRRVKIPKPGGGERPLGIPYKGPSSPDRCQASDGADLRSGFGTEYPRLPTEAECAGRHPGSTQVTL